MNCTPGSIHQTLTPFQSEEDRFRRIVETANEGIWTIDHEGRTTYVNRRMGDMLGYTPEEILGQIHTEFMFPGDQPKGDVDMESRRNGTTARWDQRYRRRSGEELWTLASCCPLYREDGTFAGALGMFTDITDRKQGETELRQRGVQLAAALQDRDDFLAMLSHELRGPLNPILLLASGRVQRAEEGDLDLPLFQTIVDNARHQARLIDDLLDLTKIGQGKLALRNRVLDVRDILAASVASLKPTMEAKQIVLQTSLPDVAVLIFGDSDRLQQVTSNVIGNAIKFTPWKGRISLTASTAGEVVRITCEDTGIGMSETEITRAFEPFAQGDHAHKKGAYGGLGLGLALSRMILGLHGGKISAASAGPGFGSSFVLEIPLYRGPAPLPTLIAEGDPSSSLRISGGRILMVDDHAATRETIGHLLRRRGFEVFVAGSCEEALTLTTESRFDLLLCDLGLPDGDGCDLMREIALKSSTKGIALTGYGQPSDIERALSAGFDLHLTKPIAAKDLEEAVIKLLSERA